jgi:hypothetical protein
MDDATKIQVLMIYYQHWGKDEIKAQQDQNGLQRTMDKIYHLFRSKNPSSASFHLVEEVQFQTALIKEIRQMSFHVHMDPTIYLLNQLSDTLLSSMGGCRDLRPLYKTSYYTKLAKMLNMKSVFSIVCMDMSEQEMLSVNAIVALL